MTEEQQENLANKIVDKIISAMEKKQEEFDEEFARSIELQNGSYRILSKEESLELKLRQLRDELDGFITNEEYDKVGVIYQELLHESQIQDLIRNVRKGLRMSPTFPSAEVSDPRAAEDTTSCRYTKRRKYRKRRLTPKR